MQSFDDDVAGQPTRNVLITSGHTTFAAMLTNTLRNSFGGARPFSVYRYAVHEFLDAAGGTFVRGSLTDRKALRSVIQRAQIHLVVHILERDQDTLDRGALTEDQVFETNVACTNALLQMVGDQSSIRMIMVTSDLCTRPASAIGNTCLAAEALWFGKAMRSQWESVVVRTSYAEPPWGRPFVQWGFELWDGGMHPSDLVRCLAILADQMTNSVCPVFFRSHPLVLKSSVAPISNPTAKERTVAKKFGFIVGRGRGGEGKETTAAAGRGQGRDDGGGKVMLEEEEEEEEEARRMLLREWVLEYDRRALLEDFSKFGHQGPPLPAWLRSTKSNMFSNNDGISAMHLGN